MLDRKLVDENKYEMIYILWKECMAQRFYQHIWKEKNFRYHNGKNVLQAKVSEIIMDFLKEGDENFKDLRNNFSTKACFSACTQIFSLRFTVQLKGVDSTLKSISKLSLKLTRTRKILRVLSEKSFIIMREFAMKQMFMNKTQ